MGLESIKGRTLLERRVMDHFLRPADDLQQELTEKYHGGNRERACSG
jgi:hypothetical protein